MGLSAELPDELKKQMDSADVVLLTGEDWTDDFDNIKYAHLFWSKLTDEQKEEEVNMLGTGYEDWLASIERIGALGVYSTDIIDDLDTITGCDNHEETRNQLRRQVQILPQHQQRGGKRPHR